MTAKQLIKLINKETGLDITSKNKDIDHVACRCIFYHISYDILSLGSLKRIGKYVNRNHGTVIHSIKNLLPYFDEYFPEYTYLRYKLYDLLDVPYHTDEVKYSLIDKDDEELSKYNDILDVIRLLPDDKLQLFKFRIEPIVKMMTYESNNI